jgi:pSer/pThr/pTyr-binding forkhead associated (FHA) protein
MPASPRNFGVLRPIGGGDPIPLTKDEIVIGRRASCDIRLDFENISGRHCVLNFVRGVWHVRDLKSTNGTFVNRQRIEHDHGILPDDEFRLASHEFSIDYEPAAPSSLVAANEVLEEEIAQATNSLTELAGIDTRDDFGHRRRAANKARRAADASSRSGETAARSSSTSSVSRKPDPAEALPEDFAEPPRRTDTSDSEFFRLIQGDIE